MNAKKKQRCARALERLSVRNKFLGENQKEYAAYLKRKEEERLSLIKTTAF